MRWLVWLALWPLVAVLAGLFFGRVFALADGETR